MIDFVQVGKKLTALRRSRGLSQEELADRLFVTRQCLSKWELGNSSPGVDTIIELCRIFDVSIDEILCLNSETDIDPNNIFSGHNRMQVVTRLKNNELDVKIEDVLYQLSPAERLVVLSGVRQGTTRADPKRLEPKLTPEEILYLKGRER